MVLSRNSLSFRTRRSEAYTQPNARLISISRARSIRKRQRVAVAALLYYASRKKAFAYSTPHAHCAKIVKTGIVTMESTVDAATVLEASAES